MELDLALAAKRLRGDAYLTLSGATVLDSASSYYEMYTYTFMDTLETLGFISDEALEGLLAEVIDVVHVGDVTGYDPPDLPLTCAMGLVLLDRIAQTGWGRLDFENCFYFHEQMFECFEVVLDSQKRRKQARAAAATKAKRSNEARQWTYSEWVSKKADYGNNKSDFARTYTVLVREKFLDNKNDPLRVTEKTIREVWLSDPPAASKPAGELAGG